MKTLMKAAAALLAGGIGVATASSANAAVRIGIGLPGPVVFPAPYYVPPPCYAYGPYACPSPIYYGPGYYRYWPAPRHVWYPRRR
jgi:hypothetical protein